MPICSLKNYDGEGERCWLEGMKGRELREQAGDGGASSCRADTKRQRVSVKYISLLKVAVVKMLRRKVTSCGRTRREAPSTSGVTASSWDGLFFESLLHDHSSISRSMAL
jgi:hypothetical protein